MSQAMWESDYIATTWTLRQLHTIGILTHHLPVHVASYCSLLIPVLMDIFRMTYAAFVSKAHKIPLLVPLSFPSIHIHVFPPPIKQDQVPNARYLDQTRLLLTRCKWHLF